VADGRVIRIDHDYQELSPEQLQNLLDEAARLGNTPENTLDLLRGRQVWLEHLGGYVSRYAHLADVASNLEVGSVVREGDLIAYIGNSGTEEAATGTQSLPHLHFELWRGDTFLGEGLEPVTIYERAAQVFGEAILPPYRE
jgi:murein DD-endopeptidase MepM/ murein hydrolase activator NlpD